MFSEWNKAQSTRENSLYLWFWKEKWNLQMKLHLGVFFLPFDDNPVHAANTNLTFILFYFFHLEVAEGWTQCFVYAVYTCVVPALPQSAANTM